MHKHRNDTGIIRLPKIAPHLRLDVVALDPASKALSLLVTSEYDRNRYRVYPAGEFSETILSAIDGRTDAAGIIRKIVAATPHRHHAVAARLRALADADLLICAEYEMSDGQAAVWLNLGFTPARAEDILRRAPVALVNHAASPAARRALSAMLQGLGVKVQTRARQGDGGGLALAVVVVDDYLQESLEKINRAYRKEKTPWLAVKLNGGVHWAGPVFNARGGDERASDAATKPHMARNFCWHCLAERIQSGRQIEQANYRQSGIKPPPAPPGSPSAVKAGAHHVALEIAKYLLCAEAATETAAAGASALNTSLWVWDQVSNQTGLHRVNKNPQCAVCGQAPARDISPILLDDPEAGTRYASSGWRVVSPERTFADYRHLNNAYTGVVDLLEDVPNESDDFCFVFESGNNIATHSDSLFISLASTQMHNAGKGTTPALARTGALCESLERYSASLHGNEIRQRARYRDFPAGRALMPNVFMNLSDKQFEQRGALNDEAGGNPFVNIPAPLAEDEYCEWSPIWSFMHREARWVPTQSLYYGYPYRGHWIAIPDTNGVAAGNTPSEAFVQAFMEVLERDAVSLWWYNRLQCAELALDSVNLPIVAPLVAQYEQQGRHCWALDISFDLGVNVFVFMSRKTTAEAVGEEICLGVAAHFDPEIALTRAICEHGQLWAMIESRREDTTFRELSHEFTSWLQTATTAAQQFNYLLPSGRKQWSDYPPNREFNLLQQRQACLDLVAQNNWQLYLADFTRPSVGLPVMRVMIPQLRSMHRRLGPGRLYEAPVEMGLLAKSKTEAEMNAVDMFI